MADTAATFADIHNENEFQSQHWIFTGDLRDTIARWREAAEAAGGAGAGARTPNEALRALARDYIPFRRQFAHERQHAKQSPKFPGRFNAAARESAETEERALLYVAATRAGNELLVLSYGVPSPLLHRD